MPPDVISDEELAQALTTGTARRPEVELLLDILGDQLLYQLASGALWRLGMRLNGERAPIAIGPVDLAMTILSYPPGDTLPSDLVDALGVQGHYEPEIWADIGRRMYNPRAVAHRYFLEWVRAVLVMAVLETPDGLPVRELFHGWIEAEVLPEGAQTWPSERLYALVAPLETVSDTSLLRHRR